MKKKLALLIAAFMLVFSLSGIAAEFSDMPGADSKYYAAFEYAIGAKIISGVDGKLLPDSSVTKAEAVTFISRAKPFTQPAADLSAVADISPDAWYYNTMAQAVAEKIIAPDANNKLNPTEVLSRRAAWDLLHNVFGNQNSYKPVTEGDKLATRGDFILWLFDYIKPSITQPSTEASSDAPTEASTEAPTEGKTEYNDLKALKAQEDMRVALGIRADGTSYTNVTVYQDTSQTDWASGRVSSSSSSSRPSGGSSSGGSSSGGSSSGNNNPTEPADEPTEDTNTPAEPETQAPTEPETQAPTYGEYDGPIDNDKDNVIDDPFNDGWRPPGFGGDGDDSGNGGGSGGFDEEDDDFNINDDDEPGYVPETKPTEEETNAPTDEETNDPSDEETNDPSDEETNAPSDEETNMPSDEETNMPSDEEINDPSDEETNMPSDEETDAPTTEPEEEAGDVTDDSSDENEDEDNDEPEMLAWLFAKDWWFN